MELTINDLSKEYGRKKAVNHFSAKLTNGVYGLLGANGAGKTTLMRMICDVQTETKGAIFFNETCAACYAAVGNYICHSCKF